MNTPTLFMSPEIGELVTAYVSAQSKIDNVNQDREVEVPIKDKQNPGQYKGKYRYRYATLPGILNHIRDALVDNGIWYTQFTRAGFMITRLLHKSGQWMDTGDVPLPDIKGTPQDIGAIISFFKRYSLIAAMGLASDDDNDGESNSEVSFSAHGRRAPTNAEPEVEEPPMGWGDFTRGLITTIGDKATGAELDDLRDANKRYINSLARVDRGMYGDIGAAFAARRAVVDKNAGF